MPTAPEAGRAEQAIRAIHSMSRQASGVGREAAEVRGVIDDTQKSSARQAQAVALLARQLTEVTTSQQAIVAQTEQGLVSVAGARQAVESIAGEVQTIVGTLQQVSGAASDITQIALQTRLVAFNAAVEANRAGEAGRGFAVVAEAVKELAAQVESSSKAIMSTMGELSGRITALAGEIQTRPGVEPTGQFHRSLGQLSENVAAINAAAGANRAVCDALGGRLSGLENEMRATTQSLDDAMRRSEAFLQVSEQLIEVVARSGIETEDTPYIVLARQTAAQIGEVLEQALSKGAISLADLFDEQYQPIPNTQPAQHLTRFAALTDRLLPPLQEPALKFSSKVVFCISADRNGYVATHNRQYNHPQRGDVTWDTANSRYRRIFNDRTGLASGRNKRPFLLQTYRRDMGGGRFVVMKEVAAPIIVQGRHWGGLRLAYKF